MKKRIISIISVTAILFAGLSITDTQPQANAQQRPPGGDSIPAPPPSYPGTPDPNNPLNGVEVQCAFDYNYSCGVYCTKCRVKYHGTSSLYEVV
ncbi:MAG: hypothetical protein K1W02_05965 [Muribaculaceae bacterium]